MSDQKPETLSAQQLQALQKEFALRLEAIGKRMEIRDRALDQACRIAPTLPETAGGVMKLAREMFEFLTADLQAAPAPPAQSAPAR